MTSYNKEKALQPLPHVLCLQMNIATEQSKSDSCTQTCIAPTTVICNVYPHQRFLQLLQPLLPPLPSKAAAPPLHSSNQRPGGCKEAASHSCCPRPCSSALQALWQTSARAAAPHVASPARTQLRKCGFTGACMAWRGQACMGRQAPTRRGSW
jgi:hypothetical protein